MSNKKRKEILLDIETVELLQIQAEKEGRKLKNYMEFVLKEKANSIELSDNYKTMIDEMLNHKEKLNFLSEEEFRNKLNQK